MMPEWVRRRLEGVFPGKMPVRSTRTSEEKVGKKPILVEVEEEGKLAEEEWEVAKRRKRLGGISSDRSHAEGGSLGRSVSRKAAPRGAPIGTQAQLIG